MYYRGIKGLEFICDTTLCPWFQILVANTKLKEAGNVHVHITLRRFRLTTFAVEML
jgi:hypothetical protein